MSTTTDAFAYPKNAPVVDGNGLPSLVFARTLETLLHEVRGMKDAAIEYTALDPGTATTADIVNALNLFMASVRDN